MATDLTTSSIDPTTDSGFRAFGLALSTALTNVGLVRVTGETGIVNWGTAVRATAWFDLYRFNDALQSTKPIFVKFSGVAGGWNGNRVPVSVVVCSGTDGSGNPTGVFTSTSTTEYWSAYSSIVNTGSPVRNNRVCYSNGHLAVAWGQDPSNDSSLGFFSVSRTVDDTGSTTGDGVTLFRAVTSGGTRSQMSSQHLNFTTSTVMPQISSTNTCWIPAGITSSLLGSTPQVFKHYVATLKIRPVASLLTFLDSEIAIGDTFTVKPIGGSGGVSHTYITLTQRFVQGSNNLSSTTSVAMIWE